MLENCTTVIDRELCNGCGLCTKVCPARIIRIKDEKAVITGDRCLNCDHCASVCPQQSIAVKAIDENMSQFANFDPYESTLKHGDLNVSQLVRLMASRRSCRNFSDKPVEASVLEDLVKIGCTAPSATNSQLWTFTVLPNRDSVLILAKGVREFYLKLNTISEKKLLRLVLKLVGKPELDNYYRSYYDAVKEALTEYDRSGIDRLFHSAPAAIIVGNRPGATLPKEDALLACQNMLLAAHGMGLGSCLIGMAVEAMKNDRKIQRSIGIPREEKVHAVIALGHSNEHYRRPAGRKHASIRFFETPAG